MQDKFQDKISEYFNKNDQLVLALSGGSDSVFLGQILFELDFKNIAVAHFNHNLRDEDSEQDEEFCKKLANKWGYIFISEKWKKPVKSEEKCRNARYEFLKNVNEQNKAKAILIAHHQDDNIETIFFNFLRGSGIKGLKGLRVFDKNRKIFRPLLGITKEEILQYLKKNKIEYREDKTNKENQYSRNYLRNIVLPTIKKEFPNFEKSILRSASIFNDLNIYLKNEVKNWIKSQKNQVGGFYKNEFINLSSTMKSEIVRKLWHPETLDFDQVNNIIDFIKTAPSGKKMIIRSRSLKTFGEFFFIEQIKKE